MSNFLITEEEEEDEEEEIPGNQINSRKPASPPLPDPTFPPFMES